MLLAIDAGNTITVFAAFDGNDLRGVWRQPSDARRTADEYANFLESAMRRDGVDPKAIDQAIIGRPPKSLMFLRGIRLLPPRAGITQSFMSASCGAQLSPALR